MENVRKVENMITVYIMVGLPGIGKSTYSKGKIRISSDDYIEEIAAEEGSTYNEVFKEYASAADKRAKDRYKVLLDYFAENNSSNEIYVDRTNMSKKSRKFWIDQAKGKKAKIVAINFANPSSQEEVQNLFERSIRPGKSIPRHVIESMMSNYEEPSFEEGFSEIIQVPFKVF